jgi:poly(A) polymerase
MPIITPAYPSMCATHNVTKSTLEIIHREIKRAQNITEDIMSGKAPWKDLFGKHTFFTQDYKYYLSVVSSSTTKAAQLKWSGLVESKVRLLVLNVEVDESVALARPFNKGFERAHRCKTDEEVEQVKHGSLKYQVPLDSLGDNEAADGEDKSTEDPAVTMVYTNTHYIGLQLHEGK